MCAFCYLPKNGSYPTSTCYRRMSLFLIKNAAHYESLPSLFWPPLGGGYPYADTAAPSCPVTLLLQKLLLPEHLTCITFAVELPI